MKDLSFSLHLPHTQFAADVCGGGAQSLQSERAMKSSLTAAPHLVEWDFLEMHTDLGTLLLNEAKSDQLIRSQQNKRWKKVFIKSDYAN